MPKPTAPTSPDYVAALFAPVPPKAGLEVLLNPGIGLHTFHKFHGELPPSQYPGSSVAYFRMYWKDLEPSRGDIQFSQIDEALSKAHAKQQTLGFRVMVNGGGEIQVPQWLLDKGIKGKRYSTSGPEFMPEHQDPTFLAEIERLLKALGARYDGDPRIEFVDIGVVGMTGEWHMGDSGMELPPLATRKKIIDLHFAAFPKTQLVMLIGDVDDGAEPLKYALSKGAGWRADCLGDWIWKSGKWNHMESYYPKRIFKVAQAADAWKKAPVMFETCGDPADWLQGGADPKDIAIALQYALHFHASLLNFRTRPIAPKLRGHVDHVLRRLGYQLAFSGVEVQAKAGKLHLRSTWHNHGVAPPYKRYQLQWRLRRGQSAAVSHTSDADLRTWLPGPIEVDDQLASPPPGTYALELRILWKTSAFERNIRLQGATPNAQGWTLAKQLTIP